MTKTIFPVEATHIMLFARALGDENPAYCDSDLAGGIIAPPTFVAAARHVDPAQLRPRPGEPWLGSGRTPTGLAEVPPSAGGLQAGQEYIYHRPLRPGDVLSCETITGKSWEKQSRRQDETLIFRERITEYRDAQGELVVTGRSIGVTIQCR